MPITKQEIKRLEEEIQHAYDEGELLSPPQVAEMVGCTRQNVNRAIDSGTLKAYRFGRASLVHPDDVREWRASLD